MAQLVSASFSLNTLLFFSFPSFQLDKEEALALKRVAMHPSLDVVTSQWKWSRAQHSWPRHLGSLSGTLQPACVPAWLTMPASHQQLAGTALQSPAASLPTSAHLDRSKDGSTLELVIR